MTDEPAPLPGAESLPDRRHFLGWQRPPLVAAVDWIWERFGGDSGADLLDLRHVTLVLPTQRSTERLWQLLAQSVQHRRKDWVPPSILTVGQLPELLYRPGQRLANELTQQLAWARALELLAPEQREALTGRPADAAAPDWMALATLLSRLHTRLANDIWSFRSVAREVSRTPGFFAPEIARWQALEAAQGIYYGLLKEAGLWDRQAARSYAAAGWIKAQEIRCQSDRQLVLLGLADINRSTAEMIRQIALSNPAQVDILVAAEPESAEDFDRWGRLRTAAWLNRPLNVADSQILIADRPADQAEGVAHLIHQLPTSVSTDQITVGVPDESVLPQLRRSLRSIQVPHRSLAGKRLSETRPVQLLLAVREYLGTERFSALAALLRHPDLFQWLADRLGSADWLSDLDEYQNLSLPEHLRLRTPRPFGNPRELSQNFPPGDAAAKHRAAVHAAAIERLNQLHGELATLLEPLTGKPRPMAAWGQSWLNLLVSIYGVRELDPSDFHDRQILRACELVQAALVEQQQVPPEWGLESSATQSLDWALQAVGEARVEEPHQPEAVELAGWLDLALDDAPVVLVTGMNDSSVPATETSHPFLPNELCKQLEILDNDRRFARDAYALSVIEAVRDQVFLIVGRRTEAGDPLKPSRLLFATDATTAARRARAFFSHQPAGSDRCWLTSAPPVARQAFVVPAPHVARALDRLSVTKFRDYLKCPYRFYLQHVLRLSPLADDWTELSGGTFGDLCHQVLEDFGRGAHRDLDREDQLLELWNDTLSDLVARQFPGSQMPSVAIQVAQLRARLERLAPLQAQRRCAGWRIVSTEEMLEHAWDVDGVPFIIRGKIDRVDQHEETGRVAVWDYKSSDKGESADKVHYVPSKKAWKDLQLPLYRHLVKEVAAVTAADLEDVDLGFILLPKRLEAVGFDQAPWDPAQLAAADEQARVVIRQLRDRVYWPPADPPPQYSEAFAAICQDNVAEPFDLSEPEVAPTW